MVTPATQIVNKPFYYPPSRRTGVACDSAGMRQIVLAVEDTSWYDIPGVRVVGAVLGALLLLAAIRSMFGKGR